MLVFTGPDVTAQQGGDCKPVKCRIMNGAKSGTWHIESVSGRYQVPRPANPEAYVSPRRCHMSSNGSPSTREHVQAAGSEQQADRRSEWSVQKKLIFMWKCQL
ncbi:hypothetical protein VZT92_016585 [Zoarces viviparus]|uniref:Uncharacterized protein n=1 Tax=Zoarces viviparus TaxID=48416 RepID=A0AAW1EVA5_ZOAVI